MHFFWVITKMKHKIEYKSFPEDPNTISYYICSCGWKYQHPSWVVSRDAFHRVEMIEHVLEAEGLMEFPKILVED